jgi:YVTN family beta-propeller protein
VTAINPITSAPTTINVVASPKAIAINPVTGNIYVIGSGAVTAINGATNATTSISCNCNSGSTESIAVNPVTNTIYAGSTNSSDLFIINGANNALTQVQVDQTFAIAVNPATNMIYLSDSNNNIVQVLNGATNAVTNVSVGSSPAGLAVNPATNTIYVANNGSGNVTVINGATNATSTVTDPSAVNPIGVAVNPLTNTIYVLNNGYDGVNPGSVSVINGATNKVTTNISANQNSVAIAVNETTNKIYAISNVAFAPGDLTVIDGITNAASHISLPDGPSSIALNPTTNDIYITTSKTTEISEQSIEQIPLTAAITPLTNNQTISATPTFSFTAASTSSPNPTTPDAVYFQVDTWTGAWAASTPGTGGAFTGTTGTLAPGFHILYAYATDGQEASSTQGQGEEGSNSSPAIGNIVAYGFLVTPANVSEFSASPSPLAFGNQNQGTTSSAATLTVTNTGTVSLTISSVAEGGTNKADFTVASDTCNGATVTAGNKCTVSVTFTPSLGSAESATLTFTDNASDSPQVVNLTGTGVIPAATPSTTVLTASAASVAVGNSVTFTATVTPASGTPTPTGTVTFKDGATTLGAGTLNGSGVATYTATSLAVAGHSITASYAGDARNQASVSNTLTVSVVQGASKTAIAASATSLAVGSSVTFTATVTGASGVPAPTGTVTFLDGATTLGTGTLNGSGIATYSTSALAAGAHSVTASYGGDANNAASVSSAVALTVWPGPPGFSISLSPSSASVNAGTLATTTVTITSINGFASATNLSCSGLPKDSTCTFSESSVTPAVAGTATSTLTIKTDTNPASASLYPQKMSPQNHSRHVASEIAMANVIGALILLPMLGSRRRKLRHLLQSLSAFLLLAILAMGAMTGCSKGPTTPKGAYTIQVNGTAGSISENATYSLTIQ